jgi:ribosomal protein S18 acetylase RimI-like enzyme
VLRFRAGQPADVELVLQLWVESEAESTHTDNPESLSALLTHNPGALIVAEIGDRIVGSVIAAWDGWRGSVYRLAVSPSHRRQGLADQLLLRAEERLAELGAVRLQAIVVESDPPAVGFWRNSGWEQQIKRLRFVKG